MCPFLHLIGTTANYAIIDASRMERNDLLDVVDLSGADTAQWLLLLRLFAKHPRAGTHNQILGLTIVNEEDKFLFVTGALVAREAKSLHIGFQFHLVKLHINQLLSIEPLSFRISEALVIASTLQLHHLLADEFVEVVARPHDRKGKAQAHATMMKADVLLRDLAELSPKLMVVTEQEADHNGKFMGRFDNALNYYMALSDALEESVPERVSAMERSDVEWCLLLQEIRDIVVCDGVQRRERHDRMVKWVERMKAAGFMVTSCSREYRVSSEKDMCSFIHRCDIPLFSVPTWRGV
ncbi:hypothetical protein VPH35_018504 [Triticum aestivum]